MITPEGGYYVFVMSFVFTGAVLREINLMLVLAGMMLGPLVYNVRTARRMIRGLTLRRRLPDTAMAGEPVTVELALSSKTRFAGVGLVDSVRRVGKAAGEVSANARTPLAEAAARQTTTVRYTLVAAERGEYEFGPVQVRSSYPFGLIRRAEQHELPATLVVFPRLGVLTDRWSALVFDASHDRAGSRRQTHSAGDFYGLRDYRSGDSRRHIHWRTSARRGKLMVRQFERALQQDVAVYLDPWQPARPTVDEREHAERAVSFAATLIHDLCRRDGCRVWLAIAGDRADPLQGTASSALARAAMTRLAQAEAGNHPVFDVATKSAVARMPRGSMRVFVTSRPGVVEASNSVWASSAAQDGRSNERHVFVSTRDASFDDMFTLEPPPTWRKASASKSFVMVESPTRVAAGGIDPKSPRSVEQEPATSN